MSDPKDILEKTDAFLKRYHPSPKAKREDIPVLTDVVTEPSVTQPPESALRPDTAVRAELSAPEAKLAKNLLDAIGPRVIATLEEPLRLRIEAHLKRALPALSEHFRQDIEALVRETVARAIEQELARLRAASRNTRP